MSRRARESLQEELEFQMNTPAAQIELARQSVAQVLAEVDQSEE